MTNDRHSIADNGICCIDHQLVLGEVLQIYANLNS